MSDFLNRILGKRPPGEPEREEGLKIRRILDGARPQFLLEANGPSGRATLDSLSDARFLLVCGTGSSQAADGSWHVDNLQLVAVDREAVIKYLEMTAPPVGPAPPEAEEDRK